MSNRVWRRRAWLSVAPALMLGAPQVGAREVMRRTGCRPGATAQDLHHTASDRTWRVWIQRPTAAPPAGGYPVLWLLDGNAAFSIAAQLARNDEARPEVVRSDPLVVVAVGHPGEHVYAPAERLRDYTPPSSGKPGTDQTGGAGQLLDFMLGDLRRWLPADLRLDPRRQTLYGHSLAGLFVLHTLLTRPDAFTRYAAASPSIWWDGARLLDTLDAFLLRYPDETAALHKRALQMRVGALENVAAAVTEQRVAVQQDRRMIDNARAVAERLASLSRAGLQVDFAVLPGLDHGAVMARGLIDAITLAQQT